MIRPARVLLPAVPARRWTVQTNRRGLAGTLRGTATLYLAPTAQNPQQVAVTGLPTPYGNPTFFLSEAVARQTLDTLNKQAAVNAQAGIGLFQAPLPNVATMTDAELCPLMSQGCVTQAQAPDRVYGCFLYNQAHPETRGSGFCSDPRWFQSSTQTNPVITPQTDLVTTSQYYAGFAPGTTQTQQIPAPVYTPYVPPAVTKAPAPTYNPTQVSTTPKATTATTPTTTTTTTTTPAPTTTVTTPAPDPIAGEDLLGDPNGFIDELISKLPANLQSSARELFAAARRLPLWGWGALVGVLLLLLIERRRKKTR